MTHMRMKLLVGGLVIVSAISFLAFAGAKKGWVYTINVDRFVESTDYHGDRVRLVGKVAPEGIVVNAVALNANFSLQGQSRQLPVAYHGVIPDLFKPGCEVVVEGTLVNGTFQSDVLMTKCASKYEEEKQAKNAQGQAVPAGTGGQQL